MAKKNSGAKKGTVQVSKGSQSINYVGLFQASDGVSPAAHKLRVRVEYDSYRNQSSGRVERWNDTRWEEVYTLQSGALQGWRDGIAYDRSFSEASFDLDVAFLLARASEVLGF